MNLEIRLFAVGLALLVLALAACRTLAIAAA